MASQSGFNHFPQIKAQIEPLVSAVVKSAAGQVAFVAAGSMEGQDPPSTPGSAPAIRTGLLHDSIESKQTGSTEAIAYTNVEYGQHLEFGTVHMEARPFMRPARDQVEPSFQQAMRSALGKIGRGLR